MVADSNGCRRRQVTAQSERVMVNSNTCLAISESLRHIRILPMVLLAVSRLAGQVTDRHNALSLSRFRYKAVLTLI